MDKKGIEQTLRSALSKLAADEDACHRIITECHQAKPPSVEMPSAENSSTENSPAELSSAEGKPLAKPAHRIHTFFQTNRLAWFSSAAALLLFIASLTLWTSLKPMKVNARVTLDVNPGIELSISESNQVLQIQGKNPDGVALLKRCSYRKGEKTDRVLSDLLMKMLDQGYLTAKQNSILLSVTSDDPSEAARLENLLMQEIATALAGQNWKAAIVGQVLLPSEENKKMEERAQFEQNTWGKTALINRILSEHKQLNANALNKLKINDLLLLLHKEGKEASQFILMGEVSEGAYIGRKAAEQIALAAAGVAPQDAGGLNIESDFEYEDSRMIYEIEWILDSVEHKVALDATTGRILKYEKEAVENKETTGAVAAGSAAGSDDSSDDDFDSSGDSAGSSDEAPDSDSDDDSDDDSDSDADDDSDDDSKHESPSDDDVGKTEDLD